jgi:DHA1 family bicyclomycin/chloramphenicol resistance-like MFS transporter
MEFGGWRAIFFSFIVFTGIFTLWTAVRLPETLALQDRRPFRPGLMLSSATEMFANRTVCLSIFVQVLTLAMLFLTLLQLEQTYSQIFDARENFPYITGAIALVAGSASLLNAVLVVRYGMQRLVTVTLAVQILLSGVMIILSFQDIPAPYGFALFLFWQFCMFFQAGLTIGNLNAIAMEPMGHIAGMAASVIGSISTVLAALIASPLGLIFDGTLRPILVPVFIMAILALILMRFMKRDDGEPS